MKKLAIFLVLLVTLLGGYFLMTRDDPSYGDGSSSEQSSSGNWDHYKATPAPSQPKQNLDRGTKDFYSSRSHREEDVQRKNEGEKSTKKTLSPEEIDEMDKRLTKYEEEWDERMKDLFIKDLGLSVTDYNDYTVMRDGFEEDRLEAFEEFHNEMARKHGNHYRYPPSLEMDDNDRKLKEDYLNLFRKRFGEEAYRQYINTLESYNDTIRRESDPDDGVLHIDF